MTSDGFEKLLSALDADRDRAGEKYEKLRSKLVFFFRMHGCREFDLEGLADEALKTTERRLEEGEDIQDVIKYAVGVARKLCGNARERAKKTQSIEETPQVVWDRSTGEAPKPEDPLPEYFRCLEACLEKLSATDRHLICEYYLDDKRQKIDRRQILANELNTAPGALRTRAFRIRKRLEACVKSCIQHFR